MKQEFVDRINMIYRILTASHVNVSEDKFNNANNVGINNINSIVVIVEMKLLSLLVRFNRLKSC